MTMQRSIIISHDHYIMELSALQLSSSIPRFPTASPNVPHMLVHFEVQEWYRPAHVAGENGLTGTLLSKWR